MNSLVQLKSFIPNTLYYVCWDWNRKLGQSWVATEIAASASSYTLLCSSLLWKWTIGKVFHYRYIQNLRIGLFVKGPLQQYCHLCLNSCPTRNWGSLSKWSLAVVKFQLLLNLFLIQFPKVVAFYLRLSSFFKQIDIFTFSQIDLVMGT